MRTTKPPKQEFGPAGEPLCRGCKTPVVKPRKTWCSSACVHEAMLRSSASYLRQQTKERDHGVCAGCGLDTVALKIHYQRAATFATQGVDAFVSTRKKLAKRLGLTESRTHQVTIGAHYNRNKPANTGPELHAAAIHKRLKKLAEARWKRLAAEMVAARLIKEVPTGGWRANRLPSLWQADHIHPVAEGGGGCGLENIQTLCTGCHKRKTADQAKRKAQRRRGIDPDAPPPQLNLL